MKLGVEYQKVYFCKWIFVVALAEHSFGGIWACAALVVHIPGLFQNRFSYGRCL